MKMMLTFGQDLCRRPRGVTQTSIGPPAVWEMSRRHTKDALIWQASIVSCLSWTVLRHASKQPGLLKVQHLKHSTTFYEVSGGLAGIIKLASLTSCMTSIVSIVRHLDSQQIYRDGAGRMTSNGSVNFPECYHFSC